MQVIRFRDLESLRPHAAAWNGLARGVPFRRWEWLSTWWKHYGGEQPDGRRELYVAGVFEAGQLIAVAPWYRQWTPLRGWMLRFLGCGEVCSDYLTVLALYGREDETAECLADWLVAASASARGPQGDAWDATEWIGLDHEDLLMARLADALARRGADVHRRQGLHCWRIMLPADWDTFIAGLSRSLQRKARYICRELVASGRASLVTVNQPDELARGLEVLIDLHQRRRATLGEPGCFASRQFEQFHRDVMPEMLKLGMLQLHRVELDGEPIAAEYHLLSQGVVYAYQSGISPDAKRWSPGRIAHLTTIRRAIEGGCRAFDFLRGDEPYKAQWQAKPRATVEMRVAAPRLSARWRQKAWLAGSRTKRWLRQVPERLRRASTNTGEDA